MKPVTILTIWVVYDNPKDYPGWYVVRGQDVLPLGGVMPHGTPLIIAGDLERIREDLARRGLICLPREEADDPCIVESWI